MAAALIIFGQLAAQTSRHDADDRLFLGVVRDITLEDLNADHVFLQLLAASRESPLDHKTEMR